LEGLRRNSLTSALQDARDVMQHRSSKSPAVRIGLRGSFFAAALTRLSSDHAIEQLTDDGILERDAFRIVGLEPLVRGILIGDDLDVFAVADRTFVLT